MITTKWACSECDCVNKKHPAFNLYVPNRKSAISPYEHQNDPGAEFLCTLCKHPSKFHKFTFKEPKEDGKTS